MPKLDLDAIAPVSGSTYPEPWASQMGRRTFQTLGPAAGLSQFGVTLVTLYPGDTSSLRHWHSGEDEFVFVIAGTLDLVQDAGTTVLRAGDCAAFAMGDTDGHHLKNTSDAEARYLVVGGVDPADVCTYSDVDLAYDNAAGRFIRHDGSET